MTQARARAVVVVSVRKDHSTYLLAPTQPSLSFVLTSLSNTDHSM